MPAKAKPTISAVVRAHNDERHVAEALTGILAQTRPPDEVIVVDDGSTDGTAEVLAGFGLEVRVVRQPARGCADALNRAFEEARCEYVANCDADDIWEPQKLEWQEGALLAHPEIDIAFGAARLFGLREGAFHNAYPGEGLIEPAEFTRQLYRADRICASSTLVRRQLFERIGRFRGERCEDYDFWLRAQAAGARFFQDAHTLVRYRAHDLQASQNMLGMHECEHLVHERNAEVVGDRALVRKVLARDLSNIARVLSDQDRPREAREAFFASLRQRPSLRTLAWILVLSTPNRCRRPLADGMVSAKRALASSLRG